MAYLTLGGIWCWKGMVGLQWSLGIWCPVGLGLALGGRQVLPKLIT